MDENSEYIVETIIRYCCDIDISKEYNYQIKTKKSQGSLVIYACVYSHPYFDSTIDIFEFDFNNKVLKLKRANGINFKKPLNDIGIVNHLDVINSWCDDKDNILIPFETIEYMLSSQKGMKEAIRKIISNMLIFAYSKQIIDKINDLVYPSYKEHANLCANLRSGTIHSAIINVDNSPWRNGVVKGTSLFASIKVSGKERYIYFKEAFTYHFKKLGIEYTAKKTERRSEMIRISLADFVNRIDNPSDEFIKLINDVFIKNISFPEFGCCSKYVECEKSRKCSHPDQLYATACQYQKLMKRTVKCENS